MGFSIGWTELKCPSRSQKSESRTGQLALKPSETPSSRNRRFPFSKPSTKSNHFFIDNKNASMEQIKTVGGVKIWQDGAALLYKTGATINGDGSPHCYHADDSKALDYLANAGSPGSWWGIATDDKGKPYVNRFMMWRLDFMLVPQP
jgi:hypothetical protein